MYQERDVAEEPLRRYSNEDSPANEEVARTADPRTGQIARTAIDLDHIFSYHQPSPFQRDQYEVIRSAAKTLAMIILANTPEGADQADAIRKVREAVMTANAAIALRGRLHKQPSY